MWLLLLLCRVRVYRVIRRHNFNDADSSLHFSHTNTILCGYRLSLFIFWFISFVLNFDFPICLTMVIEKTHLLFILFFLDGFFFCVWGGITYCELMAKEFLLSRFSPCDQRVIAFGNFSI